MLRSVFFVIRYWGGYFRPDSRLRRLRHVVLRCVEFGSGRFRLGKAVMLRCFQFRLGVAGRLGYGLLGFVLAR